MSEQDIIQTFRNMDNSTWKCEINDIDISGEGVIVSGKIGKIFYPFSDWGVFEAMKNYVGGAR